MCQIATKRCFGGQQNTHWYRHTRKEKGQRSIGWTANPKYADEGEIERVGLHDCFQLQCWR